MFARNASRFYAVLCCAVILGLAADAHAEPYLWCLSPDYNNLDDDTYHLAQYDVGNDSLGIFPLEFSSRPPFDGYASIPAYYERPPFYSPNLAWLVNSDWGGYICLATVEDSYDVYQLRSTGIGGGPGGSGAVQFAVASDKTGYALVSGNEDRLYTISMSNGKANAGSLLPSTLGGFNWCRWALAGGLLYSGTTQHFVSRMDPTLIDPVTGIASWDPLEQTYSFPDAFAGFPDGRVFSLTEDAEGHVRLIQIEFANASELNVTPIGGILDSAFMNSDGYICDDCYYSLVGGPDGMLYCSAQYATYIVQISPNTGDYRILGGFPSNGDAIFWLAPAATPEPATLALMAVGFGAVLRRRRR